VKVEMNERSDNIKAITFSIGTFSIKVRSDRAHAKGQDEEITVQIDWRTLREFGTAAQQLVYDKAVERLRDFLIRYDEHLKQKERERMAKWPPHSLFCEKRCCQKSTTSYMRYL
jgi:ribosome-associated translation inhibitor RaiA